MFLCSINESTRSAMNFAPHVHIAHNYVRVVNEFWLIFSSAELMLLKNGSGVHSSVRSFIRLTGARFVAIRPRNFWSCIQVAHDTGSVEPQI